MDDPYTMEMRMCDDSGMVSDRQVDEDNVPLGLTYLERHKYLQGLTERGREFLKSHAAVMNEPFTCTGHAHLAGEHIRCTSPAHRATMVMQQGPFNNVESGPPMRVATEAPDRDFELARGFTRREIWQTQAENKRGEWVPAIPLPFFGVIRVKCSCGAKFWDLESYEGHYALRHILYPE